MELAESRFSVTMRRREEGTERVSSCDTNPSNSRTGHTCLSLLTNNGVIAILPMAEPQYYGGSKEEAGVLKFVKNKVRVIFVLSFK